MPGFEIFGNEERKQVKDVLGTGVLFRYGFEQARKGHWKVRDFEAELAKRIGVGYCHVCSSGTAALSVALASCGVGAGDEVVVPPFTFIATVEAVMSAGAVPIFAEIDRTLCLDPKGIEAALTPSTKAVIPVHMCGSMGHIDEIKTFCDQKGLVLIEDACQAIGATYEGKSAGSFGEMGCFSFDPVKTITCGEGGAVVTDSRDLYATAHAYADHGHDHIGEDRGLEGHAMLGNNFRISELNAAVGLAQLKKLDFIMEKQRAHKKVIKDALAYIPGMTFREIPDEAGDSATFISFFLSDSSKAARAVTELGKAQVDGCFYWYDNNWHYLRNWDHLKTLQSPAKLPLQLFENCPNYGTVVLPRSDKIISRTISMMIRLSWTEEELEQRINKIATVIKKL